MGFRADLDIESYLEQVGFAGPRPEPEIVLPEAPVRRGAGPVDFTTCTELAPSYTVWDANGWYRALGFTWPYRGITKTALRLAYYAVGGQDSERLTYYVNRLLRPQVRAEYDATPLGEIFWGDKYVHQTIRTNASLEAGRRNARGEHADQESVMDSWGLYTPTDEVEVPSASEKSERSDPSPSVWAWRYGYYLWKSVTYDPDRLSRWQDLLVAAFAAAGARRRISVGFMGGNPRRALQLDLGDRVVLFLHEEQEPTEELATRLADNVIAENR